MRERDPIETAKWLNQNGLVPRNPDGKDLHRRCYNCWGFTAYMLGWEEIPRWLYHDDMEHYLTELSEPLNEPEPGAVAVFRDEDNILTHTALVVKVPRGRLTPVLVHKPGDWALEVQTVAGTYREHPIYHKITEYRRSTWRRL